MSTLDFVVLFGTLFAIVIYGVYKTRGDRNIEGYLRGGNSMKWWTIGLSVMATQASAITFLSTPGQAYESGMAFVQNYFGLPLALIIVSAFFIPLYYRLRVFTAYEFLERRFDVKTRLLGAFLFLLQRGLAAGLTIYAPAIIMSTILDWDLSLTILLIGLAVIIYTVSGGTKAVSVTQKWQMAVIMGGMFIAFYLVIDGLPEGVGFTDAMHIAGKMGKLEAVDFSLDPSKRYTIWTGLLGGTFLALSYFGTDQSQVSRYLGGRNVTESRMGLMFNAVLKVPMQFFILLCGVMVFVFFQFVQPPMYFKQNDLAVLGQTPAYADSVAMSQQAYEANFAAKREEAYGLLEALEADDEAAVKEHAAQLNVYDAEGQAIRTDVKRYLVGNDASYETKDSDYVFITFVLTYLPEGIIGLLIAVIFSAAMSSTASELNALASTTTLDFYKRVFKPEGSDQHYLTMSKVLTAAWGGLAILFALVANRAENLIEAINILGSLFYGTVLGMFIVAFFIKFVKGGATFLATVVAQTAVLAFYFYDPEAIGYLWFNVIGAVLVVVLSILFNFFVKPTKGVDASVAQ
ncbi:MAG TPA: sodium:solute symporter [Cytophagales bacterium]|nr:sodium:solute symporter [Cytophagales bacterium]HAP63692.1 sodium:solute symporter [Cytophagales bacterium]